MFYSFAQRQQDRRISDFAQLRDDTEGRTSVNVKRSVRTTNKPQTNHTAAIAYIRSDNYHYRVINNASEQRSHKYVGL